MDLGDFVNDFAAAFKVADSLRPQWKTYQPGLGPHTEDASVRLVLAQLRSSNPERYGSAAPIRYPGSRMRCDIGLGSPTEWAVEVKMARPFGDNAKPNDNHLKALVSPYAEDRSALSDADKLRNSAFACRKAILVYGFDSDRRLLAPTLEALEVLLRWQGPVSERHQSSMQDLVHPVHQRCRVAAWEVLPKAV